MPSRPMWLLRALLAASAALPVPALAQPGAAASSPGAAQHSPRAAPPSPGAVPQPSDAAPAGPTRASSSADAIRVLLEQAAFWRGQYQPEKAADALQRVLALESHNPDALAMLAQLQAERGDKDAAQANLSLLRELRPSDPRLTGIEQALRMGPVDQAALSEARRLAQEGRGTEAVGRYQRVFKGDTPPASLSAEYYQTLAGSEGGWERARDGLARHVAAAPQDPRAQLAYAKVLTYRESTRAEGIDRLVVLADSPAVADAAKQALRQALLWLPDQPASLPRLDAYLRRHPGDAELAAKREAARTPSVTPADEAGRLRIAGFAALDRGRLAEAERAFQQALARDEADADATGGLGLVRLRQGRTAEARTLLSRAIRLDPADRARWQPALAGAGAGGDRARRHEEVSRLAERGRYDEAERLLRRLMGGRGDWGNHLQLGDIQSRAGRLAEAEASFRRVLAARPNNPAAFGGLAGVLAKQGRTDEADALFARAEAVGRDARDAGRLRAERLRLRAAGIGDPVAQAGLYRAAVAADPANPWLRLEFARALRRQGRTAEGRQVLADLTQARDPAPEALQAAVIFARETGDLEGAADLVARLPPRARTPEMQDIQARAALQAELRAASALASRAGLRQRLLPLAARPDPEGFRGAEIARALFRAGDREGGRDAISAALTATPRPTPAQRLAYSGALLEAGLTEEANAVAEDLDASRLPRAEAEGVERLRNGVAVREADRLNEQGRAAEAFDRLAPRLRQDPDDPGLNMALGRLYQTARRPREALAVNEALLRRDPGDMEARRAAVSAAIAAGALGRADQLVREAVHLRPDDPLAHVMAAELAKTRGDAGLALRHLETARDLRRQQPGGGEERRETPERPRPRLVAFWDERRGARVHLAPHGAAPRDLPASEPPRRVEAARPGEGPQAPPPANPFRRDAVPVSAAALPGAPYGTAPLGGDPVDPLGRDIARGIAALREEVAPKVQVGVALRGRSGEEGLSRLTELMLPVEASFSPGGRGTLKLQIAPTFLDAGALPAGSERQRRFGTAVSAAALLGLGAVPAPGEQSAAGVGLNLSYVYRFIAADVGTTPLGFREATPVGGVELAPELAPDLRLRVTGERRAVTDSVLSYAGARDPVSGLSWGGVTRNRGRVQVEWTPGPASLYAAAAGAYLGGNRVQDNAQLEFGAGGSYPIYRTPTRELRAGLDLFYTAYDRNLRHFSLGHGGYFSPQRYFAALVPITWREQVGERFSYQLGGSVGFQTYREAASAIFPEGGSAAQAALPTLAASTPGLATSYPARGESGVIGGAFAEAEYKVTDDLRIGGRARFQRAGDFIDGTALVYARYAFNGVQR